MDTERNVAGGSPVAATEWRNRVQRQLNLVLVVAVLDALLLVPLVYGFITDSEVHKEILGPIHGVGFLILVFLTARGAAGRLWGWWFPALVIVTAGPPGSIIGDVLIRSKLRG
ncbi:MAG: hypothetical protein M3401_11970 [Actinomycetota bacterium]|nr:hypothetical protein [Actinomycetota bacterium]